VVVGPSAARPSEAQVAARDAALHAIAWDGTAAPAWDRVAPTGVATGWRETTLETGLRVLVRTAPDFPLVTVGMFTPGGSTDDPLGLQGRAWIANSMLTVSAGAALRIDGTMGAPWTRARFGDLLGRLGNRYWKGTAREYSHHVLTVRRADLAAALDLLSAGYACPAYTEAELRTEVEEVLGALRNDADRLYESTLGHARRRVYGADHPFAVPARGRPDSVPRLTPAEVLDGYWAGIKPQGAVLVFDGDIPAQEAFDLARAAFGHWKPVPPAGTVVAPLQGVVPPFDAFTSGRTEHFADKEQAMVMLATPAVAYGTASYPAADLARSLLGEWAFKELIYDKKVGYSAGCVLEASRGGGACFLFVECGRDVRERAVTELRALVQRLVAQPVDAAEFARAQRRLVGGRPLQLQTGGARVFEAGANAVLGLAPDYTEEYLAAVQALTPAALHAAVREWLDPERLAEVHVHRDAPRRDH
jgi:zinc protease